MKKELKLDRIVSCIALFCVGICFVVWADQVTEWIAILFGVIALIYSITKLIIFLRLASERRTTLSLFYIVLSFCAGLLLVSRASFIKEAISFIVGVYIILTSSIQLFNVTELRHRTNSHIGSLIWPIIGMIVGFLCVSGQFIIPDELARLTGIVLIIYAVAYLVGFLTISRQTKEVQKRADKTLRIKEGEIVKEPKSSSKKVKK